MHLRSLSSLVLFICLFLFFDNKTFFRNSTSTVFLLCEPALTFRNKAQLGSPVNHAGPSTSLLVMFPPRLPLMGASSAT